MQGWRSRSGKQVDRRLKLSSREKDNLVRDYEDNSSSGKGSSFNSQVTGEIRLSGGPSNNQGQLEVQVKTFSSSQRSQLRGKKEHEQSRSDWIPVCGDGWDLVAASIACLQLDLGFASHALQDAALALHPFFEANAPEVNKKLAQTGDAREMAEQLKSKVFMVSCSGEESKLSQCNLTLTSMEACSHPHTRRLNAAGVICTASR